MTSLIFASLRVFPGFVVIVTRFLGRSTLTVATSGCFRNVFSIPVAQKAQTIPLTAVVIVSAKAEPESAARITNIKRLRIIFFPFFRMFGPVDHQAVVAAVAEFQPDRFVKKTQD